MVREWRPVSPLLQRSPARSPSPLRRATPTRRQPPPPPAAASSDTDDDGRPARPAPPGGRGHGAAPGTTTIPVVEPSSRERVPRGVRRKVHAFHVANGSDWRTLFLGSDHKIKQLSADLTRVRRREAAKDADLARLRADRLLLNERLESKTRAHVDLSVAFNDLVQHVQTGHFDIGTVIAIVARAGTAAAAGACAAGGAVAYHPAPGGAGEDGPANDNGLVHAPSSPTFPPARRGGARARHTARRGPGLRPRRLQRPR